MTAQTLPPLPPAVAALLARAQALHRRHGARLPGVLTVLLALVLARQLALLVALLLPTPEAARWSPAPPWVDPAPPKAAATADNLVQAHLFGEYRAQVSDAASLASAPDTQLNFTLLGILAGSRDSESRALIAKDNDDGAPYAIGNDVAPGVSLQAIFPDRVILSRQGRLETLRLDKDSPSNAPVFNAAASAAAASSEDTAQMLSQIRQQVMSDPAKAASFVRVQPMTGGDGLRGYRVYPGPEREAFNAAGLKPGDVVTSINGTSLSNPAQALQLLQSLSSANQLDLVVERNGASQSLSLSVNP